MKVIHIFDQFARKQMFIKHPGSELDIKTGQYIVYLDEESNENIAKMIFAKKELSDADKIQSGLSFLRKATANDLQRMEMLKDDAIEAMEMCRQKVKEHKLDMQLAFTEFSLDGNKVNFIFTADDRVDFRELVKDLAKNLQKQIHLQQIGPRDKARIVDGCGKCGKPLCCASWMENLESITMDMVRVQCLESKGSAKLSGCCGKLMCCLRYEVDEYKRLKSLMPRVGNIVKLDQGEGTVNSLDVLNQKIKVYFPEKRSTEIVEVKDIKKVLPKKS
jgi:cell fate regulator YaaT (PSP1 superfamily)